MLCNLEERNVPRSLSLNEKYGVFSFWSCHNKIPQTGWLKQQKFISHSSGGRKSKINLPVKWIPFWDLFSLFLSSCHLTVCSHDLFLVKRRGVRRREIGREGRRETEEMERERESSWALSDVSSYKDTKQADQGSILMTSCMLAKLLQLCLTLCDPLDCSPPCSSLHGILRQEYWNGLPCPPPGIFLTHPGIEPMSLSPPALAGQFFTTSTTWEAPLWPYLTVITALQAASLNIAHWVLAVNMWILRQHNIHSLTYGEYAFILFHE